MTIRPPRRAALALVAGGGAIALALAGCTAGGGDADSDGPVTLTLLADNSESTLLPPRRSSTPSTRRAKTSRSRSRPAPRVPRATTSSRRACRRAR